MLFDAIINLFKTICIGVIAFSPLLVDKLLQEPPNHTVLTEAPSPYDLNYLNNPNNNRSENSDSTQQNMQPSMFASSGNPFGQTSPPPPPPPPVDAPFDSGIWILIVISGTFAYLKYTGRTVKSLFKRTPAIIIP